MKWFKNKKIKKIRFIRNKILFIILKNNKITLNKIKLFNNNFFNNNNIKVKPDFLSKILK
jgi:hypothetical protein